MSATTIVAFSIHLPDFVFTAMRFVSEHVVYWLMLFTLFYEVRYLCKKDRLHRIWMSGWGEATRVQQPFFFLLLWFLHLAVGGIFTLASMAYLLELMLSAL